MKSALTAIVIFLLFPAASAKSVDCSDYHFTLLIIKQLDGEIDALGNKQNSVYNWMSGALKAQHDQKYMSALAAYDSISKSLKINIKSYGWYSSDTVDSIFRRQGANTNSPELLHSFTRFWAKDVRIHIGTDDILPVPRSEKCMIYSPIPELLNELGADR